MTYSCILDAICGNSFLCNKLGDYQVANQTIINKWQIGRLKLLYQLDNNWIVV